MEGIEHRTITVNGINMHIAEKGKGPNHPLRPRLPRALVLMAPPDPPRGGERLPRCGSGPPWLMAAPPESPPTITPSSPSSTSLATSLLICSEDCMVMTTTCADFRNLEILKLSLPKLVLERVVEKFLTYRDPAQFSFPKGKGFGDSPDTPVVLPLWLSKEDVDYYASKFEQTGFTGGINYYRAVDLNWELTAPWTGSRVKVPTKFIVGDLDLVYNIPGVKEYIRDGGFKKDVPLLDEVVVMEGVGHFINQERPDEISEHILDFFKKF
ncbi:alpha/beta-Hydrolases superfamily protein [Actinidia rufa]|uniref:Alpha/beta-Hydrolases superfamily protein n=1 Tax=Actinidia rufa TaxID=165716 RepID=A0A7J0GE43_9ERIC|nr:alpha/beta-Hydrolases superfamily protein [Actinidia rufa]